MQHTFFVHFSAVVLHDYNVKLPEASWLHVLWRKCHTWCCSLLFHCRSFSPRWLPAFLIPSQPLKNRLPIYLSNGAPPYALRVWELRYQKTNLVWPDDKTIIIIELLIVKYRNLSVSRISIICGSQIIDLLTNDKTQYFAQPHPKTVDYFLTNHLLGNPRFYRCTALHGLPLISLNLEYSLVLWYIPTLSRVEMR